MSKSLFPKTPSFLKALFSDSKKHLSVFLYHDITNDVSQFSHDYNLSVSVNVFKKQIDWILNNFIVISPIELTENKEVPEKPALITFDDGFEGAFENGIKYLSSLNIPSLVFLNMSNIEKELPLVSSIGVFLEKHCMAYSEILDKLGLKRPFHLHLTPSIYEKFELANIVLDFEEINQYQGKFATLDTLNRWANNDLVFYGNHLYEHWNSSALTKDEFEFQYKKNKEKLLLYKNYIDFFSFTNGQPGLCFSQREVDSLKDLGCKRVFFSSGENNLNKTDYLLNRMELTNYEYNKFKLFYRVFIARVKSRSLKRVANIFRRYI